MTDPRANLTNDQVLAAWEHSKAALNNAQESEMEWRKYAFTRLFPTAKEGTNTIPLENGYALKGVKKLNYKLLDNQIVEKCLDCIAKVGNQGQFIAERLVNWTPALAVSEWREIEKQDTEETKAIYKLVLEMLVIDEAAPTLAIKEPKKAKR